jgi:DNA-binding NtrC family response regulator
MAYEKGFFDYMSKPIKESALKAKTKRALKAKPFFSN